MERHLTDEELEAYLLKRLPVERLLAADEHLAHCESCYARFRGDEKLEDLFAFVRADLTDAEQEVFDCVSGWRLTAFVNNAGLHPDDRERILTHLELCDECRDLERDLQSLRGEIDWERPASRRRKSGFLQQLALTKRSVNPLRAVVAASLIILLAACVTSLIQISRLSEQVNQLRQSNQVLETRAARSAELEEQIAQLHRELGTLISTGRDGVIALTDGGKRITVDGSGKVTGLDSVPQAYVASVTDSLVNQRVRLVPPRLPATQVGGIPRGTGDETETFRLVAPVGVAVLSERPTFKWAQLPGADRYVVFVRDLVTGNEIASPARTESSWTSDQPLIRGRAYAWGVEATKEGRRLHAPSRRAGDAKFKVLDQKIAEELAEAKSASGGSHLLMAIMYASHGLRSEAEAELRSLQEENPDSRFVERLSRSLK